MQMSAVLGTVIGLVFVFALVSLFCSAVTESVSNFTEKRARYLLTGLRSMLDQEESKGSTKVGRAARSRAASHPEAAGTARTPSPDELHTETKDPERAAGAAARVKAPDSAPRPGDLTLALFGHPLIRSLQTRKVRPRSDGKLRNPQYIPPKLFAQALVDTLLPQATPRAGAAGDHNVITALSAAVDGLDERFPAKRSLQALLLQAGGDLTRFQESLEGWYDGQMGRISGWYKRWAKVILSVVGLLVAITANVDTLQIAHGLYVDEPVRGAVVAQATNGTRCQAQTDPAQQRQCVDTQIALLSGSDLPVWYPAGCSFRHWSSMDNCWSWSASQAPNGWRLLVKILGWGLTAGAISFGAPFWFDALSKLGSLRTSGPKPST